MSLSSVPWIALVVCACLVAPSAGSAQEQADTMPAIPTELESLDGRPSPRGAMLRSFVLPGWGQATYDRYLRGGVYFTGHIGNSYMVFRTVTRLDRAREQEDRWVAAVRDSLETAEVPADLIDEQIDAHPEVRHARGLVSAREEQREDWIALGLFWILISGIDAYVTAQLADFPASIGAIIDERRVGFTVSVPVR